MVMDMVNPVSSAHTSQAPQAANAAAPKAQAAQPQKSTLPSDKVTLKSAGDVDHDGDNK